MNKHILMALFASVALLAGCGGGGDSAPAVDPAEAVPDSASASAGGLVSYLERLSALLTDDKEPVDVDRFAPVMLDDSEPETVR